MDKVKKYLIISVFAAILLFFSVADIIKPDSDFSVAENRNLQKSPKFSFSSLIDGDFTSKYETYVNDQFILRNFWIDTKSVTESVFLKTENNNIVYGSGRRLFETILSVDEERLTRNINSVKEFYEKFGGNCFLMIVPSSYQVLRADLPYGTPCIDQDPFIDGIFSEAASCGIKTADVRDILYKNSDKYIFYKTDHHWTTLGASLAFSSFAEENGLGEINLDFRYREKEGFFGTYYYKCKLFSAKPDVIGYYDIPIVSEDFDGNVTDTLHDEEKFLSRDGYAGFIHGNNGVTRIISDVDGAEGKILLIKDSYGNSFAPFLLTKYKEVVAVDPRYLPVKMSEIMKEDFDDILILYSFSNFSTDINIAKITF